MSATGGGGAESCSMDPDRSTLRCITDMFVEMLRNAEGGVLDLKDAVQALPPGQKRRIYDVTNVLEGVGLIVTLSSSKVKWREAAFGKDLLRQMDLQVELEALEELEAMLDNQMLLVENIIRNTKQDCSSYMSLKELCDCYPDNSVLTVQAPSGIQLDVAIPKAVVNTPPVYQIHLKSVHGPINVLLLSKSLSVPHCPVVLSFPPSEELLERASLASKAEELEGSRKQNKNIVNMDVVTKLMTSQGVGLADPVFSLFSALPSCLGQAKTESESPQ